MVESSNNVAGLAKKVVNQTNSTAGQANNVIESTHDVANKVTEQTNNVIGSAHDVAHKVTEQTNNVIESAFDMANKVIEQTNNVIKSAFDAINKVTERTKNVIESTNGGKEPQKSLKQLAGLLSSRGNRVFIQMHNSPDPDSIASACGLQYLLKHEGIHVSICYRGEIEKYSTNRMVELLNIPLVNIRDIDGMTERDDIVLIDSQKGNSNITDFIGTEIASIDHHPVFQQYDYLFQDIRPQVGACSSIITEYFHENNIDIPKTIATALLYGIKTDTLDLSRGVGELDLDMFYMLYKLADIDLLNVIALNQLQYCELKAYSNAINNIRIYDNIGIAYLGKDCPDSLLGTISDFIMSLKEVALSVVYSKREAGVKFSLRNETDNYDAGKIIMKALQGVGCGGGHKTMAGGFIPKAAVDKDDHAFHSSIENRILEILHDVERSE